RFAWRSPEPCPAATVAPVGLACASSEKQVAIASASGRSLPAGLRPRSVRAVKFPSFVGNPVIADQSAPFLRLAAHELPKLLRRAADDRRAHGGDAAEQFGLREHRV